MRETIERLGGGVYGEVFLEFDPVLATHRAVKYVDLSKADGTEIFAEPQILQKLSHDNIVKVYEANVDHGKLYVVMDYFPNGSLADAMKRGPIALTDAVRWAKDVSWAVDFTHESHFVHRDIKPGNVLIADDGSAKLSDFGIAATMAEDGTAPAAGYADHLAPEVFTDNITSALTDVYALGLTTYRLINGDECLPRATSFEHLVELITSGKFPNRSLYRPDVPQRLRKVINAALNVDPTKRTRSARDFRHGLESVPLLGDWLHESLGRGSMWHLQLGDVIFEVSMEPCNNLLYDVTTRKGRGQLRRVSVDCRQGLNEKAAERHVCSVLGRIALTGR